MARHGTCRFAPPHNLKCQMCSLNFVGVNRCVSHLENLKMIKNHVEQPHFSIEQITNSEWKKINKWHVFERKQIQLDTFKQIRRLLLTNLLFSLSSNFVNSKELGKEAMTCTLCSAKKSGKVSCPGSSKTWESQISESSGRRFFCLKIDVDSLKTNRLKHLKIGPKRKRSSSNHPFSGDMLVSGRVYRFYPLMWRKCRVGKPVGMVPTCKFCPKIDLDLSEFIDAILLDPILLYVFTCIYYASFNLLVLSNLKRVEVITNYPKESLSQVLSRGCSRGKSSIQQQLQLALRNTEEYTMPPHAKTKHLTV